MRESEGACFGAEVEEYGYRCRAKAFEFGPFAAGQEAGWDVGEVAHIYVYDAGLAEDHFPDEETDFEGKVGEHLEDDFGYVDVGVLKKKKNI